MESLKCFPRGWDAAKKIIRTMVKYLDVDMQEKNQRDISNKKVNTQEIRRLMA